MNLYRLNYTPIVVAEDAEKAIQRYREQIENEIIHESSFRLVVPSSDYAKIFKLALILTRDQQYSYEEVEELVKFYAMKLGYYLTDYELLSGILFWAERLSDLSDDEIEEWLSNS